MDAIKQYHFDKPFQDTVEHINRNSCMNKELCKMLEVHIRLRQYICIFCCQHLFTDVRTLIHTLT